MMGIRGVYMSAYSAVMILFFVSGAYFGLQAYRTYPTSDDSTKDAGANIAYAVMSGVLLIGAAVMLIRGFFV